MKQTIVFAFLLFSLTGLLFPPVTFAQYQSDTVMPDWFKNNAKWWKDDLITDSDMINALESLMIQDIIPLGKFVTSSPGLEHEGGVTPGGTFIQVNKEKEIPKYLKDVFDYWSEDIVSDGEIVNSIGYLMSIGIINSEKINKEIIERKGKNDSYNIEVKETIRYVKCPPELKIIVPDYFLFDVFIPSAFGDDNPCLDKKSSKFIYELQKWNELSMWWLLNVKNSEAGILDDYTDQAWKQYSENKSPEKMELANNIQNKLKQTQEDTKKALKSYNTAKQLAKESKQAAIDKGNAPIELEKDVEEQQKGFNQDDKSSPQDTDAAIGTTERLSKKTTDELKKIRGASQNNDNIGYEEFGKLGAFFANEEPLTDIEIRDIVSRFLNSPYSWYFWDGLTNFTWEDHSKLFVYLPIDELREHYMKRSEYEGKSMTEERYQQFLENIGYFDAEAKDIRDKMFDPNRSISEEEWDALESSESEKSTDTSNDGNYLPGLEPDEPTTELFENSKLNSVQLGIFNNDIVKGHKMIGETKADWDESKKLIEGVIKEYEDYLPGLEPDEPTTDDTSEETSEEISSESSCDDCIWTTSVQFIEGKAYPMFQFMLIPRSGGDPNCPNGTIGPNVMASQSYKTVYHLDLDGTGLFWNEDANNSCGNFGTWGDANKNYPITEDQGNFMKEKFNFDFQFESYVP